ncbi:MAG TPA: zinc-ribbon domain-containing protein [Novosphingobium sp.]|nr:zinc-ribbon domain-containing protein [Novosphingobium sp.]
MIIACPACSTRYAVPDSAIGVDGRTVRCAKCRHSWFQEGPQLEFAEPARARAEEAAPRAQPAEQRPVPAAADAQAAPRPEPAAPAPAERAWERHDPLPPAPPRTPARQAAAYYDDTASTRYADEAASSFEHAPPFRPRRNWTKIGTIAAGVFAVVTLSLTGAVAWFGLPDWVPIPRESFTRAQPDLQLDFPRKRQDRKPLPDGTEFFSVSGTISNIGSQTRYVPSLLVVLRDNRERIVYEKEIVPPKRELAPGEVVTINEALTDIPRSSAAAEIGWKPE